jgi:hypothetical protein
MGLESVSSPAGALATCVKHAVHAFSSILKGCTGNPELVHADETVHADHEVISLLCETFTLEL